MFPHETGRHQVPYSAFFVLIVLAVLVPTVLDAQTTHLRRIEIVASGTYEIKVETSTPDVNVVGGHTDIVSAWKRISPGQTFRAQLCLTFGLEYQIAGSPNGAMMPLRMVTRFPPPGLRDPETGDAKLHQEVRILKTIGTRHFRAYTIHESWEMVPGTWSFEIWHRDQKLVEQAFVVLPACGDACKEHPDAIARCAPRLTSLVPIW